MGKNLLSLRVIIRAASRGELHYVRMPLIALVNAQTIGLDKERQRQVLEKQGLLHAVPPSCWPWSEREVRVLRRDYGKPGRSLRTIAANLGRTWQEVGSKAARLGLSWPLELRASVRPAGSLAARESDGILLAIRPPTKTLSVLETMRNSAALITGSNRSAPS